MDEKHLTICRYSAKPIAECNCKDGCDPWQAQSGEWIQPRRKDYRMHCCDCGLEHSLDFRMHKGKIQFRAFRVEDGVILK